MPALALLRIIPTRFRIVDIKGLNYPPIGYVMLFLTKELGLRYILPGHYCAGYEGTCAELPIICAKIFYDTFNTIKYLQGGDIKQLQLFLASPGTKKKSRDNNFIKK